MLKTQIILFFITLCIIKPASAITSSLSWHLLPENIFDLPLELELEPSGEWSEIWLKKFNNPESEPFALFEQAIGVKLVGFKDQAALVYADKYIIHVGVQKTRYGKILDKGEKVLWTDGTTEEFIGYKKAKSRKKRSKKSSVKVNFGKISIPPLRVKHKEIATHSFWGMDQFLSKMTAPDESTWNKQDVALIQKLNNLDSNVLKMRYLESCSQARQYQLEKLFIKEIEPKLSCWGEQNPERAMYLIVALLQNPILDCKEKIEKNSCGKTTLPFLDGFFISQPKIELAFGENCKETFKNTLLHEVLHLAGVKDGEDMQKSIEQAESCESSQAVLTYKNESEEFYNDLQLDAGMKLFKTIKEISLDKMGWTEGDRAYVLGQLCTKMGDSFCARRFFQIATELEGSTSIKIKNREVSFKSAAHFALYDSVVDERSRMHELAKYLKFDPQGHLISKTETESHLAHEYFVARTTLEKIKENKGICNEDVSDRVSCEDLGEIVKTPWFKGAK